MTKFSKTLILATVLAAALAVRADDKADVLLQAAMKKETVDGDLSGAIKQYGAIVAKYKSDRAVTAMALVHMAECYQKLGDAQSGKLYERVLREYADQKEAVALARAKLGGGAPASLAGGVTRLLGNAPAGRRLGLISPDGRYVSYADWSGNLKLRDLSSGTDRELVNATSSKGTASNSVFSPDGKHVAYSWYKNPGSDLRIIDVTGSSTPRVLYANEDVNSTNPRDWSRDGKWIAVQLSRSDRTRQLGLVSAADGKLRILKSVDWRGSTAMSFSPDGRYLAYDLPASEDSEQRDVFVLAIDGSREVAAVVHPANDVVRGWTPDGKHLLFTSDRTGSSSLWSLSFDAGKFQGSPELARANFGADWYSAMGQTRSGALYFAVLGGGTLVSTASLDRDSGKIVESSIQQFAEGLLPLWSPDGKYLAYKYFRGDGGVSLLIRASESGPTRELRPKLTYFNHPRWSPDGRSFVAHATDFKGRTGIYKIDAQTADIEAIVPEAPGEAVFSPWLTPDGKKIIYRRDTRGEAYSLIERELTSGSERTLVSLVGLAGQTVMSPNCCNSPGFSLSPDGRQLAYVTRERGGNQSALTVLTLGGGEPRELFRRDDPEGRMFAGAWTPDSQAIMSFGNLIPLDGGEPRRIDLLRRDAGGLQFHPDGKRVAFSVGNSSPEQVWVLENYLPTRSASR
jgi:Tol biopolymer transport system component